MNAVGENVLTRGERVFISYEDGFYRGDYVPAKNPEMNIPSNSDMPPPMGYLCRNESGDTEESMEPCPAGSTTVSSYDETPYIEVAPIVFETFFTSPSAFDSYNGDDDRVFGGFPILIDQENPRDLRISLPGGTVDSSSDRLDEDMADFALFWDFASLHQRPRSPSENALFLSLFALLMWDALFAPLPGAFHAGCCLTKRHIVGHTLIGATDATGRGLHDLALRHDQDSF